MGEALRNVGTKENTAFVRGVFGRLDWVRTSDPYRVKNGRGQFRVRVYEGLRQLSRVDPHGPPPKITRNCSSSGENCGGARIAPPRFFGALKSRSDAPLTSTELFPSVVLPRGSAPRRPQNHHARRVLGIVVGATSASAHREAHILAQHVEVCEQRVLRRCIGQPPAARRIPERRREHCSARASRASRPMGCPRGACRG